MMSTNTKPKVKRVTLRRLPVGQAPYRGATEIMRVEVTRINLYERNPRRSKNPEYDRIKASILVSGMDQPLLVTMRPDEENYIVHAGGNTRLQILKELFETTGNERFLWVDCMVVEWTCESTVLLAHMRENELRGDLTFIDKAQAVFDARRLITEELGVGDISDRELEKHLHSRGYSISHGLISLMGYSVTVLLPLLSSALASGLGKPQVKRICNLERVARDIWRLRGAGAEAEFDGVFEALCRRHDSVNWQFEPLRQAIENEIAEAADVSIQVIRMEFDCRLSGHEPDIPDFVLEEEVQDDDFSLSRFDEPAVVSEAERQAKAITSAESVDERLADATAIAEPFDDQMEVAIELPPAAESDAIFRRIGTQSKSRVPLELLRVTAYKLAQRLAERHGIGALIAPLRDNGLGFVVLDIPAATLADQLDKELWAEVSTMWWQLTAFAEMSVAPPELLEELLDEESVFSPSVLAVDRNGRFGKVCTIDPAQVARRFWRQLNHEDWCDWLCLAHNYRELHRMANLLNVPLWSAAT
jgi:ParB family protein of integrating conjugative element (PFGI_1 class)